jgi:hypothetical protein
MPLQPEQFLKRLAELTDATLLCEILEIDSEDIIDRFDDKIEENMGQLQEIFDIDIDQGDDTDG